MKPTGYFLMPYSVTEISFEYTDGVVICNYTVPSENRRKGDMPSGRWGTGRLTLIEMSERDRNLSP
jgi:hypothetical protein